MKELEYIEMLCNKIYTGGSSDSDKELLLLYIAKIVLEQQKELKAKNEIIKNFFTSSIEILDKGMERISQNLTK